MFFLFLVSLGMRLFEDFKIKFEHPNWKKSPELGLFDTILEKHHDLYSLLREDITNGTKGNSFGRKDTPSVEQIVRAAIYKELKGLTYRELEFHQEDSRICALFVKIDELRPYSFQVYQKYISQIREESLQNLLMELNRIAINEGVDDLKKIRTDSTVVETNIHYPTNNSLVWDCIRESYRLLEQLKKEVTEISYIDYRIKAKKHYFKINNTREKEKRVDLFEKQLTLFTKTINQTANILKKKSLNLLVNDSLINDLKAHLEIMKQVWDVTERHEVKGEKVPGKDKIYSIYESHTDIICKGAREVQFGHKINLVTGKSNLIFHCNILRGNPSDKDLFGLAVDDVINDYGRVPQSVATDGGYASLSNMKHAQEKGLKNIVFNKIVGRLKNQASSKSMETRLKKWRSGIEANISNFKRGFSIKRCNWKGWDHFTSRILWAVIAYNIRRMTRLVIS